MEIICKIQSQLVEQGLGETFKRQNSLRAMKDRKLWKAMIAFWRDMVYRRRI